MSGRTFLIVMVSTAGGPGGSPTRAAQPREVVPNRTRTSRRPAAPFASKRGRPRMLCSPKDEDR
jgi:hypothetical protein